MRVLIDLQGAQSGSAGRGIGRASRALAMAIASNAGRHEIFILLNGMLPQNVDEIKNMFSRLIPEKHIVVFTIPSQIEGLVAENKWRRSAAECIREWVIETLAPEVVLITSLFEGAVDKAIVSIGRLPSTTKVAVVLHDLIPCLEPETYLPNLESVEWYYSKVDSLRRADLLLAVSRSSGYEAIDLLGFDPERIVTIYEGADQRFSRKCLSVEEREAFHARLGIKCNFILNVSAFEPRKNFEGLVRAFASLPKSVRRRHQLVLLAPHVPDAPEVLRRIANEAGLAPDELVVLSYVSDDDLIALYSLCSLFVFPSFHEGFGLPALEAMQCGAAVIGSNVTSIPEVIGREDALFDPSSIKSMAEAMYRALTEEAFYRSLRAHSIERAHTFSWQRSAQIALEALEELGATRRPERNPLSVRELLDRIASVQAPPLPTPEDLFDIAASIAANEKMLQDVGYRPTPI